MKLGIKLFKVVWLKSLSIGVLRVFTKLGPV